MRVLLDAGASRRSATARATRRGTPGARATSSLGVVMKALNQHLHAPESLRPRKAPAAADARLRRAVAKPHHAPTSRPAAAAGGGRGRRRQAPGGEEADDAPAAADGGNEGGIGAALAAAIAEDDAGAPPPSAAAQAEQGAAAAPEAAGELPRWEWQQPGPEHRYDYE